MADKVIQLRTPQAGQYGNVTGGAAAARDAGLARLGNNDQDQAAIQGGMDYANQQAQQGRPGAQMDAGLANQQAGGANGNQAGAIELARRQAMGQAPSVAARQLQAGLTQGLAQQTSMGRSARGAGALATAEANTMANRGAMSQNAFAQGGMLRSQDMAQGRGMYAGMTGQARAQEQQALGMANEFGQANQKAQDDYRLGMGNAAVGFGGVGNAQQGADFNSAQNAFNPIYAQDDANQDQQTWIAQNRKQANAANLEDS